MNRFPRSSGVRRARALVCGGVLGGEDARRPTLFGPRAIAGHLLRPTSGHGLLPGPAVLGEPQRTRAHGAAQNRLRHPAEPRGRWRLVVQPQPIPHLRQVSHVGRPFVTNSARAQGFPRVLHQSLRLREGQKPTETQRPRVQPSAARRIHRADQLRQGLGSVLHQTVHQQLPLLARTHLQ